MAKEELGGSSLKMGGAAAATAAWVEEELVVQMNNASCECKLACLTREGASHPPALSEARCLCWCS